MKLGQINKESMLITSVSNITAPIQIEYRTDGEFSVKTLLIGGKPFDCFRGLINTLEDRQAQFEQQKQTIDF